MVAQPLVAMVAALMMTAATAVVVAVVTMAVTVGATTSAEMVVATTAAQAAVATTLSAEVIQEAAKMREAVGGGSTSTSAVARPGVVAAVVKTRRSHT